jgi:hypothetical protein
LVAGEDERGAGEVIFCASGFRAVRVMIRKFGKMFMEDKNETILIHSLPKGILEEAIKLLMPYSIILVCISIVDDIEDGKAIGSGTLIKIDNKKYILTAGHVVKDKHFKKADAIGLCYNESIRGIQRQRVERQLIIERSIWNSNNPQSGPDLGLIEIPKDVTDWLDAKGMLFWNIDKNIGVAGDQFKSDLGNVANFGYIDEYTLTRIENPNKILTLKHVLFPNNNTVGKVDKRKGYDYFSISIDYDQPNIPPQSFGGASGGGVWRIPINMNKTNNTMTCGNPFLLGMTFYQTEIKNNKRELISHGWKSIYIKTKELLDK